VPDWHEELRRHLLPEREALLWRHVLRHDDSDKVRSK
jgi:hypothetical protein